MNTSFQGNYIDLIIIALLFVWAMDGWERGLLLVLADVAAFIGSFLFGLTFYSRAAYIFLNYFSLSRGFANALGFFLVYAAAHLLIASLLVSALRRVPESYFPKLWQKILGIFPALFNGAILVAAILSLVASLPIRGDIKESVVESEIGGFLIRRTNNLERTIDAVFGEAIVDSLSFLTVEPVGEESIDLGFEVSEPELAPSDRLEAAMFALVNHERVSRGISVLEWDSAVVPVARAHAMDMFENGYFSHISPEGKDVGDRLQKAGINYFIAGENLAFAPSLEIAHDGLMQSPGHRENILSEEFKKVGVGVIDGGSYGRMFVQVFTD
jgi:uncharacterized membrane protein required for colicin V production